MAAANVDASRQVAAAGTGVNEAFALRFDPAPPADLDAKGCHAETAGDTVRLHCGPQLRPGARQLVAVEWLETAAVTCTDATCAPTTRIRTVRGFTYSCAGAGQTLDCAWDR